MADDDDFSVSAFKKKKEQQQRAAQAQAAINADPELHAIVEETKRAQQQTVDSSKHAVEIVQNTVSVGQRTMEVLNQQGEQLEQIALTAETADTHARDAYHSAKELHKYKGLLPISFKNMFTGAKKKHQDDELLKTTKALDKTAQKMEKARAKSISLQQEQVQKLPGKQGQPSGTGPYGSSNVAYIEDPAEREIAQNLDAVSSGLNVLQTQANEMKIQLEAQNLTIAKIDARVNHTDYVLNSANRKIKEFM